MRLRVAVLLLVASAPLAAAAEPPPPGSPSPGTGAPGKGDTFAPPAGQATTPPSPGQRQVVHVLPTIERVRVVGNRRVPASLVEDHIGVGRGDALGPETIAEAQVRALQLGVFSRVEARLEPGSAPGLVVLALDVVEQSPLQLRDFAYGSTAVSPFYGSVGAGAAGLLGGLAASVSGAAGAMGRDAVRATLYEPALPLLGASALGGLRLDWARGLEGACGTASCGAEPATARWLRYERVSVEIDVGARAGVFDRILLGWRLGSIFASLDAGAVAPPYVRLGRSRDSALLVSFDHDSRPDTFLPRQGSRIQAELALASGAFGSDYDYTRLLLQGERWLGAGRQVIRLDAAAGIVQGDAPFFERFYAPDWQAVTVGPAAPRLLGVNFSGDSRYDALLLVAGGEYEIPLWDSPSALLARGYLSLGVRAVWTARVPRVGRTRVSSLPGAADVALRMQTPVGVVSLSLGTAADVLLKAVGLPAMR